MNTVIQTSDYAGSTRRARKPGSSGRRRPLSIMVFDLKNFAFLNVNENAIQQYGFPREQFLAMTLKDLVPKARVSNLLHFVRSAPETVMSTIIWKCLRNDGSSMLMEMQCYKFMFQGKQAMIALTREITESVQLKSITAHEARKHQIGRVRSTDIISRVDRRLMFLELNRELDRLTGLSGEVIKEPGVHRTWDAEQALSGVTEFGSHAGNGSDNAGSDSWYLPMSAWFPTWGAMRVSLLSECRARMRSLFSRWSRTGSKPHGQRWLTH